MIGQLKTNPKKRRELEDLGYTTIQIPGWVVASASPATSAETPLPAGSPRASGAAKIAKGVSQVSNQLREESSNQSSNQSNPTTSTPPPGPMEGQDGKVRAPVGSYNRLAWMSREGITKSGDKYYKLITLADSSTAWKEIEPPAEILAAVRIVVSFWIGM